MRPIKEIRRSRLAQLQDRAGSQIGLAQQIGKSRSQIYQWLRDPESAATPNSKRTISDEVAREIEQSLGLPRGWMDFEDALGHNDEQRDQLRDADLVTLAILPSHIEPGGAHTVSLPRQLLKTRPDLLEPQVRVAWKEADDMRGEIEVGDLVFVDTAKNASPPSHDGIYAVRLGKLSFIKRVRVLGNGGFRLQGSNPQLDAIDLFEGDLLSLVVEGRVVAKLSYPSPV